MNLAEQKDFNAYHTYTEIITQALSWQAVLRDIHARSDELVKFWREKEFKEVLFSGCGSTYYLSMSAAYTFQSVTGLPARAYPASELVLFPKTVIDRGGKQMLVAISRSGETTETLRGVEKFQSMSKAPVIGITCYEDSQLAQMTSPTILVTEGKEESVAQTRSFSSMLVASLALNRLFSGEALNGKLLDLPEDGAGLIAEHRETVRGMVENPTAERFFFLGSGPNYGIASEAMLKMKEMSLSHSEAFHFLEFRHGPMSMVNTSTLVVGLLGETGFRYEVEVLKDMRALGAKVLAISPKPLPRELIDFLVVLPGGYSDMERLPLYLPVLQLMAFYRAAYKNLNPDHPSNLTAVVHLDI